MTAANDNAVDFDWQPKFDEDDEFRVDLIGEDDGDEDGGVTEFIPSEGYPYTLAA